MQLECGERCDVRPEHLELEACVASVLAHLELQGVCFNARVRALPCPFAVRGRGRHTSLSRIPGGAPCIR